MRRGSGGIAIVASVAGYFGLPNASVYGPSKAALINLAELLYVDLRPRGLSVYLINPGFVQTSLTAKNDDHAGAANTAGGRARDPPRAGLGPLRNPLPAPLYAGAETVALAALPPALPADFTTGTSMTQLDALLDWYATMTPDTITRAAELYAADAHFRDPFNNVRGVAAIETIMRHMFAHTDNPHFIIGERIAQGEQAFATWTFVCTLRGRVRNRAPRISALTTRPGHAAPRLLGCGRRAAAKSCPSSVRRSAGCAAALPPCHDDTAPDPRRPAERPALAGTARCATM
jgi:hypothetical protein